MHVDSFSDVRTLSQLLGKENTYMWTYSVWVWCKKSCDCRLTHPLLIQSMSWTEALPSLQWSFQALVPCLIGLLLLSQKQHLCISCMPEMSISYVYFFFCTYRIAHPQLFANLLYSFSPFVPSPLCEYVFCSASSFIITVASLSSCILSLIESVSSSASSFITTVASLSSSTSF